LLPLLKLKKRQTRHEERSLVAPNKQRITPYGVFSASTRRAMPHFLLSGVIIHLFGATKRHSFCLAEEKMGYSSDNNLIENTP
jgi:hypothetical protein